MKVLGLLNVQPDNPIQFRWKLRKRDALVAVSLIFGSLGSQPVAWASTGNGSAQLSLPTPLHEPWTLTQGPHNANGGSTPPLNSLDLSGGSGHVLAARDGVVESVASACNGKTPAQANLVVIDHGGGWHTSYYHLPNVQVSPGDKVARGRYLGDIGTGTGCWGHADGPHTHFSLWNYPTGSSFSWHANAVDLRGVDIGGWTVSGVTFSGCMARDRDGHTVCAGQNGLTNDGTIGSFTLTSSLTLSRYTNGPDHWVTASAVAASYVLEGSLGALVGSGVPGSVPLYGCLTSVWDHFLSTSSNCEGQTVLRQEMFIWTASGTGRLPLYRCATGTGDHFETNASDCEGQRSEGLLGYTASATALNRYYNANVTDHWVSTGTVTSGYNLEGSLGKLVTNRVPSTVPLYGCLVGGRDHMLSRDSNCEGGQVLYVEGWLYTSPNGDSPTPLYRCYTGSDHFASNDPNCEWQHVEGLLGWLYSPLSSVGGPH
jgi:murein DD-endopeptidase MepM/ murein hydrolase activator NlpD